MKPSAVTADTLPERIRLLMKLRTSGVKDTRVLSAMESVPREKFVPDAFRDKAYEDTALPIDSGQTISQPTVVAWMSWALSVGDRMRVLEIGTGSGYQAAILSRLCRMVYTVERHKDLLRVAEARFKEMNITNIMTQAGDGSKGWKSAAPFDRIMVTAAAHSVPAALIDQLAEGGVMVIPVGSNTDQILLRIEKTPQGIVQQHLMDVRFVPLVEGSIPKK
jgi:protein-L-isoaspartate(D-aspartate) O-methyltransferase